MEQTEVQGVTGSQAPVVAPRSAFSQQVRASMEAIRVARDAARVRARRQTMRTRVWFATSVAAIAVVAFAFGPRIARRRHARAQAAAPVAATVTAQAAPAAPAEQLEPSDRPATMPETAAAVVAEPQTPARAVVASEKECDTALIRRAPWRLSPDACARAFASDPGNGALALAVAHAALVRGRFPEAEQWARRALALDPRAAEAYVIIARAEKASERAQDARADYARYLAIAPRGWHRAEARAALDLPSSR